MIMRKAIILTVGMIALSSIGCAAPYHKSETASVVETMDMATQTDSIAGGWNKAESPEITPKIETICQKAFEGMTGVSYTPVALLSTQIVAGTNYRILFRATPVVPNAEEVYAIGCIYEDLNGNIALEDIQMTSVKTDFNNMEGGWKIAESPVLTDKVKNVFEAALNGFTGVAYAPFALLGSQSVEGTNYAVLCNASVVYPGAKSYYAIVYLNEDFNGNSKLLDIVNLQDETAVK